MTPDSQDLTDLTSDEVLDQTRSTILVVDQLGLIVRAHGGYGLPLGYRPEEVVGRHSLDIIAAEDLAAMAATYRPSNELPVYMAPEPFPLQLVGADGVVRTWDCVLGGIEKGGHGGWVVVLTCRSDQNVAVKATNCFIAGGGPLEIAAVVTDHFNNRSEDKYEKRALVVYRRLLDTSESSAWQVLAPPKDTPTQLVSAVESCLEDPHAPWNHIASGEISEPRLPVELQQVIEDLGIPFCTAYSIGTKDEGQIGESQIVFLRFSGDGYAVEGNNQLAMREVNSVLVRALSAERSHALLGRALRSDALTGVANRLRFDEFVTETEDVSNHAVLFVDIDEFKWVNDQFGHGVGDATLRHVADRIVAACRPHDLVARVGGDEFAVILCNVADHEAQSIATRIRTSVSESLPDEFGPTSVSVTVGVAEPAANMSLAELVRQADHAMLNDKTASRTQS